MIIPVILNGGMGTRLWPFSTPERPKQFHKLFDGRSTFQLALLRGTGKPFHKKQIVIGSQQHRSLIKEDIAEVGTDCDCLLEPVGRNTCAAVTIACLQVLHREDDPVVFIAPSDHLVRNEDVLMSALQSATPLVKQNFLVTFGIKPRNASPNYGYIKIGNPVGKTKSATGFRVEQFVEKPEPDIAKHYVEDGYLWNSGMFLFRAKLFLDEVRKYQPDVYVAAEGAFLARKNIDDQSHLDSDALETSPSISVDYGLFEKTDRAAVVPVDLDWNDIGCWEEIKKLVDFDAVPLSEDISFSAPKKEKRPWGKFERLGVGETHQVKKICVLPKQILSLQSHQHRSEHWIIVSGEGEVIINDAKRKVATNDAVYIPQASVHRLENTSDEPLVLIEVQIGHYLGEDDITRFEDAYHRETNA